MQHLNKNEELTLVLFVGSSYSGKTTLSNNIEKRYSDLVHTVVSATNREPRSGEVDGIDYYFYDKGVAFEPSNFLESEKFANESGEEVEYGTPYSELEKAWEQGKVANLVIEPKGAKNILDNIHSFVTSSGIEVSLNKRMILFEVPKERILEMINQTTNSEDERNKAVARFDRVDILEQIDTLGLRAYPHTISRIDYLSEDYMDDYVSLLPYDTQLDFTVSDTLRKNREKRSENISQEGNYFTRKIPP